MSKITQTSVHNSVRAQFLLNITGRDASGATTIPDHQQVSMKALVMLLQYMNIKI